MAKAAKKTSTKTKTVKKATTKKASPKKATTKSKAAPAPATTKAAKPAAEKKAPVKQTEAKKTVKKTTTKKAIPPTTQPPGVPMIDTNFAAESAAKMLMARPAESAPGAGGQPSKESSAFKNLKEQIAKPKPTGLGNLFGPVGGEKKFGNQGPSNQQKGHNQTFGGINKAVPRRTNG